MDFWDEIGRPAPARVLHGDVELRRGSRVRLRANPGPDALDRALAGGIGVVCGFEVDDTGRVHVSVTFEDDPGRHLGDARIPAHRFLFPLEDVQPVGEPAAVRVLVAGIGNVFHGDDAFGVEVARRLAQRPLPAGVEAVDFGIRGLDLAYALQDGYDAAILVDAAPRGEPPGTLSVIEPDSAGAAGPAPGGDLPEAHGMNPVRVLGLARALGHVPPRILVVGCEPSPGASDPDEVDVRLSPPVAAAVENALQLVEDVIAQIVRDGGTRAAPGERRPT
jgi:hydrogenase maturation protease